MIEKRFFGNVETDKEVSLFTLKSKNGMKVEICNYGAAVVSIFVPDKNGKSENVVLGYDSAQGYEKCSSYFGAIVGRYGNRIGKGIFVLDGKNYQLDVNDGENHLHGGKFGFNKRIWDAEPIQTDTGQSLKLTLIDNNGEMGYAGTVKLDVIYTLSEENELIIDYLGETDETTILNPTHHSYFNLSGDLTKNILDHHLMLNADYITYVDKGFITTGELNKVENTPFDFRNLSRIGENINSDNQQIKYGLGYDHNWVINNWDKTIKKVGELYEPVSGRFMEIFTDQPGIQFYSGNFLNGEQIGKNGIACNYRTGLCLETQHFPDSPNKPSFPSVIINPGEQYVQKTIYKFSTK
ncbi:MAG: Aldose 1-epimerase [Ignavibacteria bacterium]|nr:MAG: Aldose 1-epimerase [Ignavibacteria bacterium]KAF0160590.1 MAG: Aldose 1-epimerase [Ignavibacteria bacterium]